MKLFGALSVLDIALSQSCTPEYAAQQRCWDDCDLSWRKCLSDFFCEQPKEWNPSRCTDEQKNYCWMGFQSCKYECPCGDTASYIDDSEAERIDTRSTCLSGCPCSDSANKKEYCDVTTDELLVMRNAEIRYLEYQIQMNPDTTQHLFTHTEFKEAPNEWPFYNIYDGCSFSLMGRMFLVGGEEYNCQAYGCGYRNYEVFKNNDGVSLYQLQNLPINFAGGSCAAYTDSDAMICSSTHYKGTSNYGRECYHFDGRTYRPAGFTEMNHHRGKVVAYSRYDREGNGIWNIGGDYETGNFFFEQFNNDVSSPSWRIETASQNQGLVGLYGFTAVSVTYEHFLGQSNSQQMFIFGGWNENIDQPSHSTYYLNGQGQIMIHPQHFKQLRSGHTSIVKNGRIYHIGGVNVNQHGNQGPDTVEIWDMRWNYDPGFERGQTWCPEWCFWGISDVGGVCSSRYVGTDNCSYHYDTALFNRELVNPGTDAWGFFATQNPIAYFL